MLAVAMATTHCKCSGCRGARTVIGIEPYNSICHSVLWPSNTTCGRECVFAYCPCDLRNCLRGFAPVRYDFFDGCFVSPALADRSFAANFASTLRPGGQLVLETIYVPDEKSWASTPPGRYARMRNVWLLPTVAELATWLSRTGFVDINVVDKSRTTTFEQRSTEWMSFESLREALKPDDPELDGRGLACTAASYSWLRTRRSFHRFCHDRNNGNVSGHLNEALTGGRKICTPLGRDGHAMGHQSNRRPDPGPAVPVS